MYREHLASIARADAQSTAETHNGYLMFTIEMAGSGYNNHWSTRDRERLWLISSTKYSRPSAEIFFWSESYQVWA
jgi:hypothetical protein